MAYMSQEHKKELAPTIKSVLSKYGMKGTIGIKHHSTLVINIKSGKLDIIGNWYNKATEHGETNRYGDKVVKPEYMQVNEYWIDENYTGEVKDFLNELHEAAKGPNFFNNDDIQTDYFHRSHYIDIHVGKWDRPYVYEG